MLTAALAPQQLQRSEPRARLTTSVWKSTAESHRSAEPLSPQDGQEHPWSSGYAACPCCVATCVFGVVGAAGYLDGQEATGSGVSVGTVWPSGLRRWLKAPFRKGVGSNPTAVNYATKILIEGSPLRGLQGSPLRGLHAWALHVRILARDFSLVAQRHAGAMAAPLQRTLAIEWTHWGLSPGPSACEADVIPLHHVPLNRGAL